MPDANGYEEFLFRVIIQGNLERAIEASLLENNIPPVDIPNANIETQPSIVQNNFNSSNYVYNAIEQLNRKIKDGDTLFLEKLGFRIDTLVLYEVEIN